MKFHTQFIKIEIENWQGLSHKGKIEALKLAAQIEKLAINSKNPTSGKVGSGATKIFDLKPILTRRADSGNWGGVS